ncbi:hypothetical protein ACHQM5_025906 [Ranunculus cassubicifolius]
MALQTATFLSKPFLNDPRFSSLSSSSCCSIPTIKITSAARITITTNSSSSSRANNNGVWKASAVPNSNYVMPLETSSLITRPLAEILRDLNKRVPDKIIDSDTNGIPWYHANRMLSFYAPGWCGEISDVIFSENGSVTVVYRVTIRGSDGEAHRESSGTVSSSDGSIEDPVAAAEAIAFVRACARFGLGLYLHHEEETE